MCDGEIELSDRAKSLWGKTNRVDDTEWLPLYVHMADSAAMAARIWDTWVPYGTKSIISRDLGNDDDLARKLMIFLAGVHDIGKATPVFQAKPISFGPDAESLVWKPEQAGLPMIAGLRDTSHPTHPIAGQVILERYFSLVHKWGGRESRQYACVVGGHHGTPPDKSKLESARLGKTESGLDSEVWKTTQNELIEFIAGTVGMGDEEWELLSKKRFSAQSAVLATGLVIMADWIASDSDADMFPLVRVHPLWEDEESFGMTEREYDDIQSWSGLKRRAERAWACVQLPHAWEPADIPSSCQDLFSTRFRLPEGAHPRPVQEQAVRVARNTDTPGLLIIEAPMGEGKTEAALAAAEILAQRTGRGGICVALPTMATTDAMFSRVHRWLDALPSRDSTDEKTVWLAHGKAKLNDDFQGIIAASRRHFSSLSQDDTDEPYSRKHGEIPPETVISDWLWGRKKGALANFLVCTVDQVLMGALQMKHVVLRQLAMANKVVIVDECHAYDAYMREYLKMALEWLGSTRTPVILLSATLPESQREEMAEAYLKGWKNSKLELPSEAKHGGIRELKRRQLAAKTEKVCVNAPKLVQEKENSSARNVSSAYPVLTYTSDTEIKHMDVKPSGRSMNVRCQIVDDSDEALISLLDRLLENGGCVGVICDTVGRAQHAAKLLGDYFGSEYVKLTHSRFMDIDRMSNEAELRQLLGPDSTVGNGGRPQRMIVVGTQVLEQSLDIDFDALVTDIAPVDLIMQRLGRVHRHRRGDNEFDRPSLLRGAACYIRGIAFWNDNGPEFAKGVDAVYDVASLMESLAVLELTGSSAFCTQCLPKDIARTVRNAYGDDARSLVPTAWNMQYDKGCEERVNKQEKKRADAHSYLIQSVAVMNRKRSLVDWFSPQIDEADDDKGQRAVRDTQDTVEVILLCKRDGEACLLPWIGDKRNGIERGAVIPVDTVPCDDVAKVAAQCSVRLPVALCAHGRIDTLIAALEKGCETEAVYWQESPWLAGKLALFLHEDVEKHLSSDELCGYTISYSRGGGLTYAKNDTAGIKTPVKGNTHINKGKIYPLKGFLGTGWLGGIGGVYAEGANLFETLMLNWVLYDDRYDLEYYRLFGNVNDIPVWEKDEVPSADMDDQSSFAGPVQAMTWQSRRIRLVPNEERTRVIGVVNCYGDAVTLYNTDGFEKMTAWRRSIPQQKKLGLPTPPHMPVTHDASKALWRGLEPILCVGDDGDFRPGIIRWLEEIRTEVLGSEEHVLNMVTIHAQGMTYGTQSSFFETGIDDNLSLSMMMFRHDYAGIAAVVDVVKRTDKAVTVLTTFVRNLRSAAGEHSGKTQEIADQIRESAYADLDMLFRDRLANFDESQNPVAYSNAWLDEVHRMLLMMGRDYLSQSPVPVFEEHESGRFGVMSAPLAQLLFRGSLNKELGRISD